VQRGNDGAALIGEPAEQAENCELVVRIEVIGRFIEQKDARLLGEQCGHRHPALLSAGEGVGVPHGEILQVHRRERLARQALILGRFPLPVEVIQMALPIVSRKIEALGLNPKLRHHPDGSLYITDEGNFILDCACGSIPDPAKTAAELRNIVGIVEHGLFVNMASLALIAGDDGVREVHP